MTLKTMGTTPYGTHTHIHTRHMDVSKEVPGKNLCETMNKSIDPNVYRGTDRHIYITVYMFRQGKWAKDTQKIVKQLTGKMDRRTNEYSGNLTIRHPAKSVICKKRGKEIVE